MLMVAKALLAMILMTFPGFQPGWDSRPTTMANFRKVAFN